jgi:hypothetical protein
MLDRPSKDLIIMKLFGALILSFTLLASAESTSVTDDSLGRNLTLRVNNTAEHYMKISNLDERCESIAEDYKLEAFWNTGAVERRITNKTISDIYNKNNYCSCIIGRQSALDDNILYPKFDLDYEYQRIMHRGYESFNCGCKIYAQKLKEKPMSRLMKRGFFRDLWNGYKEEESVDLISIDLELGLFINNCRSYIKKYPFLHVKSWTHSNIELEF